MPYLSDDKSRCEKNQKIIVSKDIGPCKHITNNPKGYDVRQFRIDGEIIKEGEKCDWLVTCDDKKNLRAYFIELKGSDINKAIRQVEETCKLLKSELNGYEMFFRIIYKSGSHDVRSSSVTKWKQAKGCDTKTGKHRAELGSKVLEEEI